MGASLALLLADTWGMHDSDIGTGWMIVMMLGMVVFWGLVIFGIVWLLREGIGEVTTRRARIRSGFSTVAWPRARSPSRSTSSAAGFSAVRHR